MAVNAATAYHSRPHGRCRLSSSRATIFLGAGASRTFGFPLTRDLLPAVLDGIDAHELRVFLAHLFPGIDPSDSDPLPLITDVLSAIDYAVVSGHPPAPGVRPDDLRRMRILVERELVSVLDRTERQPDGAHAGFDGFIRWITEHGSRDAPLALISSNYDTLVDATLAAHAPWRPIEEHVDFGFAWRDLHGAIHPRPATPSVRLYKLHGSLNWLRCDLCEHIYIDTRTEIARHGFEDQVNPANACECRHGPLRAVLVTPSFVRDLRDTNLVELWRHALEALRTSREWIIVGYSLPPEDLGIRSMFVRAYNGRDDKPRVRVVQRGDDPGTRARYRMLFGECTYETGGFEAFLDTVAQERS